ncbi:MAG TPA: zinc ribbon domain-containing protein [Chloroflexota bacterium]|jgi:putative FmdB family regulatory protein|nr:zinc ribbon domain-containing protein [Chloroflexota bacterium]
MPVYEYYCSDCHTKFEALRSMSAANEPMECSSCGGAKHVNRTITTFARIGGIEAAGGTESGGSASMPGFGGGGCCGGSCGCGH